MPMLSRKTFATNSQKYFFLWDVWFECQIVCFKIEHLWIINKMKQFKNQKIGLTMTRYSEKVIFAFALRSGQKKVPVKKLVC